MKSAIAYVQRYGATSQRVREVLERRVKRAFAAVDDPDACAEALGWVPTIVATLEAAGTLDDRVYAELYAASLHRAGRSRRMIQSKMNQKGVPRELAEHALARLSDDSDDVDGDAARAFAKKRRLGPFRRPDIALDDARRRKELGAFARAGFPFDLARRLVMTPDSGS